MKILYIASEDFGTVGGGKVHFFEIASWLAKLDNKVMVVIPEYCSRADIDYGLDIRYVPTLGKSIFSRLVFEFLEVFFLAFYILSFKPEVVYSRSTSFNVIPPLVTALFRVPYIIEKNGLMRYTSRSWKSNRTFIKILVAVECIESRLADSIVCITKGIKNYIAEHYRVEESKMMVIPNGTNPDLFRPLDKKACRRRMGLSQNVFYVGFVGHFFFWQGLDTLIKAAKEIKDQGFLGIKYLLVGDGKAGAVIRQMVDNLSLTQDIALLGFVEHNKIVYYINCFDICYLSAKKPFDLSPLKLYEYLSCGKPVIACRQEGVSNIVKESECGYIFEPGDVKDLSKAIIQSYKERDSLQDMGLAGRKLVKRKYTWERSAGKVMQILEKTVRQTNFR